MTLLRLPGARQVVFDRAELDSIMRLYGRMVAAGLWRDYAIDLGGDHAVFSAFRRASERPEARIVKDPGLAARGARYLLLGEGGQTLRRGNELGPVLAPLARRLLKIAD